MGSFFSLPAAAADVDAAAAVSVGGASLLLLVRARSCGSGLLVAQPLLLSGRSSSGATMKNWRLRIRTAATTTSFFLLDYKSTAPTSEREKRHVKHNHTSATLYSKGVHQFFFFSLIGQPRTLVSSLVHICERKPSDVSLSLSLSSAPVTTFHFGASRGRIPPQAQRQHPAATGRAATRFPKCRERDPGREPQSWGRAAAGCAACVLQ